jgi:hypothetical protein
MHHWKRWIGAVSLGSAAVAAFLLFPSRPGEGKMGNQIIIMSTASVRGEVSPCG